MKNEQKIAILLSVVDGGRVDFVLHVEKLDVDFYCRTYGSLRAGLEQLYSRCSNTYVFDYWIIDSVRICCSF